MELIDNSFVLSQEVEKNKKLKEAYKLVLADRRKTVIIGGPDFEVCLTAQGSLSVL